MTNILPSVMWLVAFACLISSVHTVLAGRGLGGAERYRFYRVTRFYRALLGMLEIVLTLYAWYSVGEGGPHWLASAVVPSLVIVMFSMLLPDAFWMWRDR